MNVISRSEATLRSSFVPIAMTFTRLHGPDCSDLASLSRAEVQHVRVVLEAMEVKRPGFA